jgi:hypothetical protein
MYRSGFAVFAGIMALILLSGPVHGQTMVEAAGLGAAASTGAGGARSAGKSINGVFRNLDKTLKSADSTSDSKEEPPAGSKPIQAAPKHKAAAEARPLPERAAPEAVAPRPQYEDAGGIQKGIGSDELQRRFGPPVMQIAGGGNATTMIYLGKGGMVQVELQGGKIASVEQPR